ncbi:MAG: tetratricopeptide repeat protein, partial [Gammaproteobacteria bacterium]|nr:tetratricopeptide repeat protein [Gammaproteobacteria bacterium]
GLLGNWPQAEEASNKIITLAPERTEGHINLGNVLVATGRAQEAEQSYRKALTLGDRAEAWFGLGTALSALERHADAEPALSRALRLDSSNADFRNALATCLDRQGRSAESAAVRAGSPPS